MNQGAPKTIDMPSSAEVSETEKQARKLGILKDQARKALLDAARAFVAPRKAFREIDADHAAAANAEWPGGPNCDRSDTSRI